MVFATKQAILIIAHITCQLAWADNRILYRSNVKARFDDHLDWVQLGQDIDGEMIGDRSGAYIAMSGDGSTVGIGSQFNSNNKGSVRVFKFEGGIWRQRGEGIDGERYGDMSGRVSLSHNGDIVAIGAVNSGINHPFSGNVRVFEYGSDGSWTQLGLTIPGAAGYSNFGSSVSLSADGKRIAAGAPTYDDTDGVGRDTGHVQIFDYVGTEWVQVGNSILGEGAQDFNGWSVSLTPDGSRVAVGAFQNQGNGVHAGQVRVFEYTSGTWSQLGADIDGESANDKSGYSVSISDDGSKVAVGAPYNTGSDAEYAGHVRIFEYDGSSWVQMGEDIDGTEASDLSGSSISLTGDGNRVAIGAFKHGGDKGSDTGQVRIFDYDGTQWVQNGDDILGEEGADESGKAVSISKDGLRVAIGAHLNDAKGDKSGSVRVFQLSSTLQPIGLSTASPSGLSTASPSGETRFGPIEPSGPSGTSVPTRSPERSRPSEPTRSPAPSVSSEPSRPTEPSSTPFPSKIDPLDSQVTLPPLASTPLEAEEQDFLALSTTYGYTLTEMSNLYGVAVEEIFSSIVDLQGDVAYVGTTALAFADNTIQSLSDILGIDLGNNTLSGLINLEALIGNGSLTTDVINLGSDTVVDIGSIVFGTSESLGELVFSVNTSGGIGSAVTETGNEAAEILLNTTTAVGETIGNVIAGLFSIFLSIFSII